MLIAQVAETAGWVTAIAAVSAAIISLIGVVAIFLEIRLDHDRRCRQATLETWVSTAPYRRDLRDKVTQSIGNEVVDEFTYEYLEGDPEAQLALERLLAGLEQVSLGVNTGVFDFETIDRLAGGYLIRTFAHSQHYIEVQRVKKGHRTLYTEYESLAGRIHEHRTSTGTMVKLPEGARAPKTSDAN